MFKGLGPVLLLSRETQQKHMTPEGYKLKIEIERTVRQMDLMIEQHSRVSLLLDQLAQKLETLRTMQAMEDARYTIEEPQPVTFYAIEEVQA